MNYVRPKIWESLGFRARLVICLSGVFGIILAIGYWSLFLEFQDELEAEFNRSLYNYAADLLQNVELNPGGEADLPFEVIFSADKIFPFPHGDALVKIYRNPFHELFSFSTDSDAPKNLAIVHEHILQNKDNQFLDLYSENGSPWRGILMQIDDVPVPELYFFVAVPKSSLTDQISKFRSIFIVGQIIILIASGLMISILAKGLLKSLEVLTDSIHQIPMNNFEFQFSVPPGPPEITGLTKLLNLLLTRVQQNLSAHQEFVAQSAHQLKTPLTIARGHLEQLQQSDSLVGLSPNLETAISELDIMAGTITNLLNLVQIESGFQTLKVENIDVLDLLLMEADHLDYLARKKSLKFQVRCQDKEATNQEWFTQTDPQLLSIIFNNLLENAIKYACESPIEITVVSQENALVFKITNQTNPQVAPLSTAELKEKYIRGNTPEPGQGLGLYIAYKIAFILNIELQAKQESGTFSVSLRIPKHLHS